MSTEAKHEAAPCNLPYPITDCPHMRSKKGDTDMSYEHYECLVCGRTAKLDYDEMR